MKTVQGFVTRSDYVDNTPGVDSTIFELSTHSKTYTRDIGEYADASNLSSTLYTFQARDAAGMPYTLPGSETAEIFMVVQSVIDYGASHFPPINRQDLIATIQTLHTGKLMNFTIGSMIVSATLSVPEWLSWTSVTHPDLEIKVWLSDPAFQEQYTGYEVLVSPPIDNLDDFFSNYGLMVGKLGRIDFSMLLDRMSNQIQKNPETFARGLVFDYVNPNNPTQKTPTNWGIIGYGKNGDNIDTIKDEIVEHILKHSMRPRADWEVIFPDIFKRTEFLVIPRWDQIAINNLTPESAIYSSFLDPVESVRFVDSLLYAVDPGFIEANLHMIPFEYKSVMALILNGVNNVEGKKNIKTLFPDYLPVPSTSPDFNRMSVTTKDWVLHMATLLQEAERATQYSSIKNPLRRVYRDNVMYISLYYLNINFLVAARYNAVYPK